MASEKYELPASAAASALTASAGAWSFDDSEVAARFDREALCHIPDYEKVIELSIIAIENLLGGPTIAHSLRVADIGFVL